MRSTFIFVLSAVIVLKIASSCLASSSQSKLNNDVSFRYSDSNQILLARSPIRISSTALKSFLKRFRPRQFKLGSKSLFLGRNDIRHILQSHHRSFYNPTGRTSKIRQTFFDDRMKPDAVVNAIESVIGQKKSELAKLGANGGQVNGVVNGVKYVLGIDGRGRVRQFYPAN